MTPPAFLYSGTYFHPSTLYTPYGVGGLAYHSPMGAAVRRKRNCVRPHFKRPCGRVPSLLPCPLSRSPEALSADWLTGHSRGPYASPPTMHAVRRTKSP